MNFVKVGDNPEVWLKTMSKLVTTEYISLNIVVQSKEKRTKYSRMITFVIKNKLYIIVYIFSQRTPVDVSRSLTAHSSAI